MDGIGTSNLIGALELGDHLTSFDDGALEIAAEKVALGPTTGCPPTRTLVGLTCVTDGALEIAAEKVALGPTTGCPPTRTVAPFTCASDDAPTTGLQCLPTARCH